MVLLAVMGNMLTDWLKHYLGSTPGRLFLIFGVTALALAILVTAAYAAGAIRKKLSEPRMYAVEGKPRPEKRKGLIAFVSLKQRDHLEKALTYHSGELQRAWLIATEDAKPLAIEIREQYEAVVPISIVDLADQWELTEAKSVVERIYEEDLDKLREEDVIADFTGGTKPMTAGMIFACMTPSRKLQYVPADYRNKDPKPLDPIEYALDSIREEAISEGSSQVSLQRG